MHGIQRIIQSRVLPRGAATFAGPSTALNQWFNQITSASPTFTNEVFDPLRARQIQISLPTRIEVPVRAGVGDELPRGHHLIYFQPETPLAELGRDGSSTVCWLHISRPSSMLTTCQGIQRSITLPKADVGRRLNVMERSSSRIAYRR